MDVNSTVLSTISTDYISIPTYGNHSDINEFDWQDFNEFRLPVFIFLVVILVVGLIGNIHAQAVFYRYPSSPVTILIQWMVLFDLLTCGLCIPLEMVFVRYTFTYPSLALCKITRFLTHYISLTTGTFIVIVAIERRQKVCAPFNWQLSERKAKQLSVSVVLTCLAASAPAAYMYDLDTDTTIKAAYAYNNSRCSAPSGDVEAAVYSVLVVVIISVGFVICAVAYIQIIRVIRKQIKKEKNRGTVYSPTTIIMDDTSISKTENHLDCNSDVITSTIERRKHHGKRYKDSRRMTIMLLIATCVSFSGYMLHVLAVILNKTEIVSRNQNMIFPILISSYYLHCGIQPIVYLLVDPRFMTECKHFYSKIICWLKRN